jgi:hypothetical protein
MLGVGIWIRVGEGEIWSGIECDDFADIGEALDDLNGARVTLFNQPERSTKLRSSETPQTLHARSQPIAPSSRGLGQVYE